MRPFFKYQQNRHLGCRILPAEDEPVRAEPGRVKVFHRKNSDLSVTLRDDPGRSARILKRVVGDGDGFGREIIEDSGRQRAPVCGNIMFPAAVKSFELKFPDGVSP